MKKLIANPYSGIFIDFEGIDGSGKTTQAALLVQALKELEYPILHTFEPTKEYSFGKLVRSIYTSPNPMATLSQSLKEFFGDEGYYVFRRHAEKAQKKYLEYFEKMAHDLEQGAASELAHFIQICMTFDRYDHRMRVEIPALKEGTHVISDRDYFSTLAYGMSEGIPLETLIDMQKNILDGCAIVPDMIIFLDTPPAIAAQRMAENRKSKERFDEMLEEVSRSYREIVLNPELNRLGTIVSIDGVLSEEIIHHLIMRSIEKMM